MNDSYSLSVTLFGVLMFSLLIYWGLYMQKPFVELSFQIVLRYLAIKIGLIFLMNECCLRWCVRIIQCFSEIVSVSARKIMQLLNCWCTIIHCMWILRLVLLTLISLRSWASIQTIIRYYTEYFDIFFVTIFSFTM